MASMTASGAPSTSSTFTDEEAMLLCARCRLPLEPSKTPKLLPCLHSVCSLCFERLQPDANTAACPLCKIKFPHSDILPNHLYEALSHCKALGSRRLLPRQCPACNGKSIKLWVCIDCNDTLCDQCVEAHRRVKLTANHTIQSMQPHSSDEEELLKKTRCPRHPKEELVLFCEKCRIFTCRDCQLQYHPNHTYDYIEKRASQQRNFLKNHCIKNTDRITNIRSGIAVASKRLKEVDNLEAAAKAELGNEVSRLVTMITQRGKQLVEDVERACKMKRHRYQIKLMELQTLSQSFAQAQAVARATASMEDDRTLLECNAVQIVDMRIRTLTSKKTDLNWLQCAQNVEVAFDKAVYAAVSNHGVLRIDGREVSMRTANPAPQGQAVQGHMIRAAPIRVSAPAVVTASMPPRLAVSTPTSPRMFSAAQVPRPPGMRPISPAQLQRPPTSLARPAILTSPRHQQFRPPPSQPVPRTVHAVHRPPPLHRAPTNINAIAARLSAASAVRPPANGLAEMLRTAGKPAAISAHEPQHNNNTNPATSSAQQRFEQNILRRMFPDKDAERMNAAAPTNPAAVSTPISQHLTAAVKATEPEPEIESGSVCSMADQKPNPVTTQTDEAEKNSTEEPSTEDSFKTLTELATENIEKQTHVPVSTHAPVPDTHQAPIKLKIKLPPKTPDRGPSPAAVVPQVTARLVSRSDGWDDYCSVCKNGGILVCCDHCPRVFCADCHVPPVPVPTPDVWYCGFCQESPIVSRNEISMTEDMIKVCLRILLELYCQNQSIPFHFPIDEKRDRAPGYYSIVSNPMDFRAIRVKLLAQPCMYNSAIDFMTDLNQVFINCGIYNEEGCEMRCVGMRVAEVYRALVHKYLPALMSSVNFDLPPTPNVSPIKISLNESDERASSSLSLPECVSKVDAVEPISKKRKVEHDAQNGLTDTDTADSV